MVRLRDAFVSGLASITFADRQFDRAISDGPSMAWASNYACTEAGWQCRSPGPHTLPAGRQSQGDQRCATQIDVL
jgi:hypothetical protein